MNSQFVRAYYWTCNSSRVAYIELLPKKSITQCRENFDTRLTFQKIHLNFNCKILTAERERWEMSITKLLTQYSSKQLEPQIPPLCCEKTSRTNFGPNKYNINSSHPHQTKTQIDWKFRIKEKQYENWSYMQQTSIKKKKIKIMPIDVSLST